MQIIPFDDYIAVEKIENENKIGSIIIPETANNETQKARVYAVGTDPDIQEYIHVGDTVLFGKYSGDEIEIDGKNIMFLDRSSILAILRGDE